MGKTRMRRPSSNCSVHLDAEYFQNTTDLLVDLKGSLSDPAFEQGVDFFPMARNRGRAAILNAFCHLHQSGQRQTFGTTDRGRGARRRCFRG